MRCEQCQSKGVIYRFVNGEISSYLCTLCLADALIDVVTNNNHVTFVREQRLISVFNGSVKQDSKQRKDSIGE